MPISYLDQNQNVLWHFESGMESDAGYHYGADISLLSQVRGGAGCGWGEGGTWVGGGRDVGMWRAGRG